MVRHVLGAALLTLMLGACSSVPGETGDPGAEESAVGSVNLPLTSTVGDTTYRLSSATFIITGPALNGKPRVVKPPADEAVHNEVLPVGDYSIELEKGWVLEKRGANAKLFTPVSAQLVTPNPLGIQVTGKTPADAFFGFATVSGDVSLGDGSVNIRIGVQDCSSYDTYMAALGALTADCLGTVDPRAYEVTKDGMLRPTFDSCPVDATRLTPIRQLLSLQQRTARLPYAKQCMAGRFEVAQQKFANSGVNVCPTWTKSQVLNPITEATISTVLKLGLPELPAADTGQPPRALSLLKEDTFYTVSGSTTGQKCQSPADCAAVCASAFPGFVLSAEGERVLTDPTAWLLDTTYSSASTDPYLRAGYYHPMSYYGPLPGAIFGEFARFQPCGPQVSCNPELCSYYAGSHIKTFLQRDCLDPANVDTCVSFCGPKLP